VMTRAPRSWAASVTRSGRQKGSCSATTSGRSSRSVARSARAPSGSR
jgi:hypothetical protein